jgi:micrococcal nuclease
VKIRSCLSRIFPAILFLLCLRPFCTAWRAPRPSDSLAGIVTYVYDGDTIKVRLDSGEEKKVRLIGVDSPEYNDPQEKVRLSAFLAHRFVYSRLYQKPVRLTWGQQDLDVYGRLLAYVWTDERTMFNETLVREGYARAYLKYPFDEVWERRFREVESEARQAERGLWRRKPYDIIGAAEAGGHVGGVVTVRFRCVRIFDRSRFHVLVPAEGKFEAVVPLDVLASFPGSLDFENREMEVTGLVEEYEGRPQIMIGIPIQIRIGGSGTKAADSRLLGRAFDTSPFLVNIVLESAHV